MLERFFGDIWQLYLLAAWCSALTAAVGLLTRYIHGRSEEFPVKTMQGVLKDWKAHRERWALVDPVVVAEHVRRAGERTLTCSYHERAIGRLETNVGEIAGVVNRLGVLEAKVEEQSQRIARNGRKNEAEHGDLMAEIVKVGLAVASIDGRLEGYKDGRRSTPRV